jgi:hypothetical protein
MFYAQTQAPIRTFTDQRLIDNFINTLSGVASSMYEATFLLTNRSPYGIYLIIIIISLTCCVFLFIKYIYKKRSFANSDKNDKDDTIRFEANDFEVQMQLDLATSLIRMKEHKEAKKILVHMRSSMTDAQRSHLEILKSKLSL